MGLKSVFPAAVWNAGQQLYKQNRVQAFRASGNLYMASVADGRAYGTEMTVVGDHIYRAQCECGQTEGNGCRHLAALAARVMYYQSHERKVHPRTVALFPDQPDGKDHDRSGFFNVADSCKKVRLGEDAMNLANAFAGDGRVRLKDINSGFLSYEDGPVLKVTGQYEEGHVSCGVAAYITHDALLTVGCEMPGCYAFNNGYYHMTSCCPHGAALLLLARDRLERRPVGYGTDRMGGYLMSLFEGSRRSEGTQERRPAVRLEARLVQTEDGSFFVDFKCGTDKLYVVRNVDRLFEAEQQRTEYEQNGLKIDFSKLAFAPECAELAEWARKSLALQNEVIRHVMAASGSYARKSDQNRILLAGDQLDRFFDWGVGRTISQAGTPAHKVILREEMPELSFTVEPMRDRSGFVGVRVTGKAPALQFSDRYAYYMGDGVFSRTGAEALLPLRRLLESVDVGRGVSFSVGRDDLAVFYRNVLPMLKACADVTEKDQDAVIPYIPPKPVFAFYLDYLDQTVLMEAKAAYGDQEYNLYDGDMIRRDQQEEARAAEAVSTLFSQYDPQRHLYALQADEGKLYDFLTEGLDKLNELGEVHATDRFSALRIRRRWQVTAGVSLESGMLDLTLLSDELSQEELAELLNAYAAKKRYHRLQNGDFIALEQEETEQLDALFEAAHVPVREFVSGHMHLPQYRALYLDRVLEEHEAIVSERDRHYRELIKTFKTIADSDFEVPDSLAGTLRPYQKAGYQWLMTLYECGFGGILADDMGLGKTLQMIAVFEALRLTRPDATHLVICPASLVYNWIDEIRRFAPQLRAVPVAGGRTARQSVLRQAGVERPHVLVTSYDLFKRDVAEYEALDIHIAVLDEAQFIKNQSSAAARSVKALSCAHRFVLTGTPVENRLSELWSIFDFLMPGFLYGYETFRRELETPIVRYEDSAARERLRRMVAPFILRRLKKDVLRDLPDKHEEQRRVELEGKQRKLYDAQVLKLKHLLHAASDEDFRHSKLQVLAELTRLRQLCCDPALLYEDYGDESAKCDALMQLLTTAADGGHKVLVFSQFTSMLSLIEQRLAKEGLTYMVLTGETEKRERLRLANAFNTDGTNVFLISLRAGGTGLNLTGADIVVHYDPWWNFAVEQQATDRAHRIGQTRAVTVYKLIAKDTVEERIVALQDSKRDLAEGILSGDSVSLKDLSRDDLLELIG